MFHWRIFSLLILFLCDAILFNVTIKGVEFSFGSYCFSGYLLVWTGMLLLAFFPLEPGGIGGAPVLGSILTLGSNDGRPILGSDF